MLPSASEGYPRHLYGFALNRCRIQHLRAPRFDPYRLLVVRALLVPTLPCGAGAGTYVLALSRQVRCRWRAVWIPHRLIPTRTR